MKRFLLAFIAAAALGAFRTAGAEEFLLTNGGRVVGELLNPDQVPRADYRIKTASGVELTLARSQVREIRRPRPEEIEYEKVWPRYPDTVEGQWQLAEWCRERTLLTQRQKHLKRVLELDPNHEQARRALGYVAREGNWTTRDEEMKAQGYVLYKGQWKLPQEVELLTEALAENAAKGKWAQELGRWRGWLKGDKADVARDNIVRIKDPYAVEALARALKDETREPTRKIFIEALANIGTVPALQILAVTAIKDSNEEVRLTCLDFLKKTKNPDAVQFFMGQLGNRDNTEVNRAAVALREMGDPAAIAPLIDALVTTHKSVIPGKDPRQMSVGFGNSGGGGISMGGGPVIKNDVVANRPVLDALVALAGGPNFSFDKKAWKSWYASQHRFQQELNARRD